MRRKTNNSMHTWRTRIDRHRRGCRRSGTGAGSTRCQRAESSCTPCFRVIPSCGQMRLCRVTNARPGDVSPSRDATKGMACSSARSGEPINRTTTSNVPFRILMVHRKDHSVQYSETVEKVPNHRAIFTLIPLLEADLNKISVVRRSATNDVCCPLLQTSARREFFIACVTVVCLT